MPDQNRFNDPDYQGKNSTEDKDILLPTVPTGMTLENIIDRTGELEHLNELVLLQLEKEGGFTGNDSYFSLVQPLLDLLEIEIRVRCHPGMDNREMKLLVQDWIDKEIAELKKGEVQ